MSNQTTTIGIWTKTEDELGRDAMIAFISDVSINPIIPNIGITFPFDVALCHRDNDNDVTHWEWPHNGLVYIVFNS